MNNKIDSCSNLKVIDLRAFKTDNKINMENILYGSSSLISIDVSKFNNKNVIYFDNMINGCSNATSLDISNFNTEKVKKHVLYVFMMFQTNFKILKIIKSLISVICLIDFHH
jgi:surface protein